MCCKHVLCFTAIVADISILYKDTYAQSWDQTRCSRGNSRRHCSAVKKTCPWATRVRFFGGSIADTLDQIRSSTSFVTAKTEVRWYGVWSLSLCNCMCTWCLRWYVCTYVCACACDCACFCVSGWVVQVDDVCVCCVWGMVCGSVHMCGAVVHMWTYITCIYIRRTN